jgi:hypothetical protein
MEDRLNMNYGSNYCYPGFARYGLDAGRMMTNFLFADASNPFAGDPASWPTKGLVRIVTRKLNFTGITNGTSSAATDFRPTNGRNFLILWRSSVVTLNGGTTSLNSDFLLATQTQTDGTVLDDNQPTAAIFGSGQQPYVLVVPDMVLGTATRQWAVTNNTGSTADVFLSFAIAYLDLAGK